MEIYDALPYDIVSRIRQNISGMEDINDDGQSFYTNSKGGKIEIRISNHCTHLWTWHERHNGEDDDITRISIVFETENTYSDDNLILKKHRRRPLKVMEFVYRIENPQVFTSQHVLMVINSIKYCLKTRTMFNDMTGLLTYKKLRVSRNPSNPNFENNILKKENINYNMKNRIRLTESQLHRVIKESVRRVLKEDTRFPAYKHFSNPLFTSDEAKYWDTMALLDDTEYQRILKMIPRMDKNMLYKKLGHDKYNAFVMRLEEDNPEIYKKFIYDPDTYSDKLPW